ncbi:protein kinase domain-containing protein [Archangium violaceum]|uniref:protein kinase domain-containing protein n=1 Tax=Archangium violaceum TaxID=83451 RepID=UPI0036D9D96B
MTQPEFFADIGRFEVCALLSEGATGRVYRVFDRETSRTVALETLRLPSVAALSLLKQEFRVRAGILHPNLLQFHELFIKGDSCFFTMEAVEGVDFIHWSREEPGLGGSWTRLSQGFLQLCDALRALHSAGLVHCDIKPSNVLVTAAGRVVVLGSGLTCAPYMPGPEPPPPRGLLGHPAYMAPEQVTGGPITPSTDLYALGAMLYEVLAGSPPFAVLGGNPLEHKVHGPVPHVLELAPHAPEKLAQLTMELLSPDPTQRPDLDACSARLSPGSVNNTLSPMDSIPGGLFVGRAPELTALAQAFDTVASQHQQVTVYLHGPSGIGKTSLVSHFLAHQPPARVPLLLHGRSSPHERVPYAALDTPISALARHLQALPAAEASALVPSRAQALARRFPVLGQLTAFQREPTPTLLPDVAELRRQGAQALRELFEGIARGPRPLVMWLDDVQWADTDSAPLLEELLRPPAPPFLLLLSWRGEDHTASPLLCHLLELTQPGEGSQAVELAVGALPAEEVGTLASALLGPAGPSSLVRTVVALAGGNPFNARELARHIGAHATRGGPVAARARVDVTRLLVERIQSLPEEEHTLLEVASLAGRPLARGIALQAAGLGENGREQVASLRDRGLLREVPVAGEPGIGAYHDRIREALLGMLPAKTRALRHRSVAEALTARGSEDDEALLLHWEGAGEPHRAGFHAVRSAERADRALAFENATVLYRKALELLGSRADRPFLLERLAEALAHQGRAEDAAWHYLEAARALGEALEQPRVRDLKRRASEQYLKSGRFEEGWRELHAVLRALGVHVPGSLGAAAWAGTWRRMLVISLPMNLEAPAPPSVSSTERHRMEVLWSACMSWTMVNPILADIFRTMHLLGARRLGDATMLSRAMATEASMEMHIGGALMEASAARLMGKVRQLVDRTGEPYERAFYGIGLVNQGYTQGHWRQVVEESERADALFREHCPGSDWERVILAIFHHHALAMLGELRHLAERLESFRREARHRGDLHARCEVYLGEPVVAWLARDKADEVRARTGEGMAAQSPGTGSWPVNAYRRQYFAHLITTVYTAHYLGEPWLAWRAVLEQWKPLRGSFMLALRTTGLNLRHMRARAALAAAASLQGGERAPGELASHWDKRALLADAHAQVRIMNRDPLECALPLACLVRAGLDWQKADMPACRRWLEEGVEGFARESMALYRESARYALGAVRGGAEGQALQRQAREWMEGQGVVRPGTLAAALVPGVTAWPETLPAH